MEIRVDKKETKGQRSAAQKKKVDSGAYNVGLTQGQDLDEKNASYHPMDRTSKHYPKIGNPNNTHRITDRSESRQSATSESAAIQRPEIKEL
jgi:hypothetical protein